MTSCRVSLSGPIYLAVFDSAYLERQQHGLYYLEATTTSGACGFNEAGPPGRDRLLMEVIEERASIIIASLRYTVTMRVMRVMRVMRDHDERNAQLLMYSNFGEADNCPDAGGSWEPALTMPAVRFCFWE
ncbi:MAG: hypothetical protein ACI8PT_004423 [Gammaproteobacteria bacterium]|jgi:hypothetical protein